MDNEIAVYKEEDFKQRVTKSVQSNIGMLIPDEQFDKLVANEVQSFFEEEIKYNVEEKSTGYGSKDKVIKSFSVTPFRNMIWSEIKKQMKVKVKEELQESEVAKAVDSFWDGPNRKRFEWNEFVSDLTKKIAPKMAEKMFERIVAEAVDISSMEIMDKIRNQ